MRLSRPLFAISACLPVFSVLASTSHPAVDWNAVDSWVQETLKLSENLDAKVRDGIQTAIREAVKQIRDTEDTVLSTVWLDLLRFGSTLQANFMAWKNLDEFDFDQHVNGETLRVEDPTFRKALSEAVFQCSSLELLAQTQVTEILQSFKAAVEHQSGAKGRRKPSRNYKKLGKFLLELEKYMEALQGQTQLITRRKILEAARKKGGAAASTLLVRLDDEEKKFFDLLEKRFSAVLNMGIKCQESGLLLDGVVGFMMALNEL